MPQGVVLISTKLAELLEVNEGEQAQPQFQSSLVAEVHIARSERVSRQTVKQEVLGGSMRHQSAFQKTWRMVRVRSKTGSVPPEVKARMPWRGAQQSRPPLTYGCEDRAEPFVRATREAGPQAHGARRASLSGLFNT